MITAGIDCGARNTKTVILHDGKIIGRGMVFTGFDQDKAVASSFAAALKEAGISQSQVQKIGKTGAGKDSLVLKDIAVSDILAIARAANFFSQGIRTVTDVGAEEARAVRIDGQGGVVDFAVNDKCAAGAGAFVEAMARALEQSLEDMGHLALQSDKDIALNAQCAIFAESEVVGLIHAKTDIRDISRAIHDAIANRIVAMLRRVGINGDVAVIGGMGRNPGFIAAMQRELSLNRLFVPDAPEFGAAVGAAIVASEGA